MLDSMIANADFVSILPDPSSPNFDSSQALGDDCDDEQYLKARQTVHMIFHPSNPTGEGIDRRNIPTLLPSASEPELPSNPYLMVVGHDPRTFGMQSKMGMGIPMSLTQKFVQPAWESYNAGLVELVSECKRIGGGVRIAKGAGHVIQKDQPELVKGYIEEMLEKVGWSSPASQNET